MGDNIIICSVNVRGLSDNSKRQDVFNWLKKKEYSIYCIQDFHGKCGMEKVYMAEWGYKCIFNIYNSNSRGVAILFNNNFEFTVHDQFTSQDGNIAAIDISIYDQRSTIVCLYGPNRDTPEFYDNVCNIIDNFENASVILCEDWNLVLDYERDTKGYLHKNNPVSRDKVLNMMEKYDIRDIWRVNNENTHRYTWKKCSKPIKMARLYFFSD